MRAQSEHRVNDRAVKEPKLLRRIREAIRAAANGLAAVIGWTGFAVANNLNAIYLLGLSPLGAG